MCAIDTSLFPSIFVIVSFIHRYARGTVLTELIELQGQFWWLQSAAMATFIALCFIEGVVTRRAIGDKPPPELVTDGIYWLLSPLFRVLSNAVVASLLVVFSVLAGHDGHADAPRLLQGFGPLSRQPTALIMVEALVVSDLVSYWAHRAMHRVPWLWRFHAVHHSAKDVRWSTIARVHPVNEVLNYVIGLLPCVALGLPLSAVLAMIPAMMCWALAVHSKFDVTYGPLSTLLVSPVFHRWHHTHVHEGGDSNFANVFSLWDKLFGTHYLPAARRPSVFGLDDDSTLPDHYLGQLMQPLGLGKPAGASAKTRTSPVKVSPSVMGAAAGDVGFDT